MCRHNVHKTCRLNKHDNKNLYIYIFILLILFALSKTMNELVPTERANNVRRIN